MQPSRNNHDVLKETILFLIISFSQSNLDSMQSIITITFYSFASSLSLFLIIYELSSAAEPYTIPNGWTSWADFKLALQTDRRSFRHIIKHCYLVEYWLLRHLYILVYYYRGSHCSGNSSGLSWFSKKLQISFEISLGNLLATKPFNVQTSENSRNILETIVRVQGPFAFNGSQRYIHHKANNKEVSSEPFSNICNQTF